MEQGWAYYNWTLENDPWLAICGVKRKGEGYVSQEAARLMEQAKHLIQPD